MRSLLIKARAQASLQSVGWSVVGAVELPPVHACCALQVSYGCRHLKQNLKLEMPRVNAPTPQERETEARRVSLIPPLHLTAQQVRGGGGWGALREGAWLSVVQVRTQELLKEKYVAMQQEWGARVAKFHKLMSQLVSRHYRLPGLR
jgi:hypothetical protein